MGRRGFDRPELDGVFHHFSLEAGGEELSAAVRLDPLNGKGELLDRQVEKRKRILSVRREYTASTRMRVQSSTAVN